MTTLKTEWRIRSIEKDLGVKFPASYREFLIERGTATIAGYTILGIPEKPQEAVWVEAENVQLDLSKIAESDSCPVYGNRKYKGKITCYPCYNQYSADTMRRIPLSVWIKDQISSKEDEPKPLKRDLSVVEAYQFLIGKRSDLADKKLIPICFKTDLNTDKLMVLCMDLSQEPKDDDNFLQRSFIGFFFLTKI